MVSVLIVARSKLKDSLITYKIFEAIAVIVQVLCSFVPRDVCSIYRGTFASEDALRCGRRNFRPFQVVGPRTRQRHGPKRKKDITLT